MEYSYAIFAKYIKMLVYDARYSKFFLGVPGVLLLASGISTIFGLTREAVAIVLSILGCAFIIRAFDIDKSLSALGKPTPTSFIRIFSLVSGLLIIVVSIVNGLSHIPEGIIREDMTNFEILTNKAIVGSFLRGTILLLWIGIGTILSGTLLSNWFRGSIKTMSDILRLVILILFCTTQFYNLPQVLTEGTSPFNLISSLLIGLAITLVAATFLYQYYRNRKGGETLKN